MCWRNVWPAQVDGEIVSSAISADCFFTPQPSQLCDYCFLSPALQITVFCHLLFFYIRAPLSCLFILGLLLFIPLLCGFCVGFWLILSACSFLSYQSLKCIPSVEHWQSISALVWPPSVSFSICPLIPTRAFFCETLPFYWSRADTHSCLRFCSKHLFNDMNVIACFVLFKPNSHNK